MGAKVGFISFSLESFFLVLAWVLGLLKIWSFIWDGQPFWRQVSAAVFSMLIHAKQKCWENL